jgi:[citrate (pro-3S)-lyase] ligase
MFEDNLQFVEGSPLKGRNLKKLKSFLSKMNLDYNESIDYTVLLLVSDEIVATGSLASNILVDFAIDDKMQGENLSLKLITKLLYKANEREIGDLYIFTKPSNIKFFKSSGFKEIMKSDDVALLCTDQDVISKYIDNIKHKIPFCDDGVTAAIVMKADPFTYGHRYLVETASKSCDRLLLFVVQEGDTFFKYQKRYSMISQGVADLHNVYIFGTSSLMVSPLTFPSYFYKGKSEIEKAKLNINLDLKIFYSEIASKLNITKRFIGTEPYSEITALYNQMMKQILPSHGIEVVEIERVKSKDRFISATDVREAFLNKNFDELKKIVPSTTFEELKKMEIKCKR